MNDTLTHTLALIQEFVEQELYPLEPVLLQQGFGAVEPLLQAKRREVKARGWWLPHFPAAEGGMGLTLSQFALVSEVLGRTPLGHYTFNCAAPDIGNMEILHLLGTPQQQERYLRPLLAGQARSCFAMTEPEHAGSNPVWLSTTAARDGDDYIIDGHKWFSTAADGAAFAIVMAVTNPSAEAHNRASQIIVPTDTPGYLHVRRIKIMGEEGEGFLSHSELRFHQCRVPAANLLGKEGEGVAIAQLRLGPGRIHHCMRWIGICERSLDLLCRRALRRELAPGKLLAQQQTVQNWIAESRAEIDAARLLVLDAARRIDAEGSKAARIQVSTIKFFVARVLMNVLERAIQVHGALGVTDDTVLAYWYRHERGARIYDGPDEVHKSVVARHVLRGYGARLV